MIRFRIHIFGREFTEVLLCPIHITVAACDVGLSLRL